ncbi:MAG TPA: hypothetical protein V6D11_03135 [Waterburya sp.]
MINNKFRFINVRSLLCQTTKLRANLQIKKAIANFAYQITVEQHSYCAIACRDWGYKSFQ